MGDTTDHLLDLAASITDEPDPREMDLLLATGEHISGTLVAMALQAIGVPAISLTGAQAGIRTDRSHGRARIANVDPGARPRGDRRGQGRHRGRLPGRHGRDAPARRGDHARPRRLGHHGGRARGAPPGRQVRDLHRRRGHLHDRPARGQGRPAAGRHRLRGDARDGPPGRAGHADPRRGAGLGQRRDHRRPLHLLRPPRHAHQGGQPHGAARQGPRRRARPQGRQGDPRRASRTSRASPAACSTRWPPPASAWT